MNFQNQLKIEIRSYLPVDRYNQVHIQGTCKEYEID